MTIDIQPNRYLGKRNKKYPAKAVVNGNTICVGESVTDAKSRAIAMMAEAYEAINQTPEVRIANDGSILVGRLLNNDTAEYTYYRRDENGSIRSSGSCVGRMTHYDKLFHSLREYMDSVVDHYNN